MPSFTSSILDLQTTRCGRSTTTHTTVIRETVLLLAHTVVTLGVRASGSTRGMRGTASLPWGSMRVHLLNQTTGALRDCQTRRRRLSMAVALVSVRVRVRGLRVVMLARALARGRRAPAMSVKTRTGTTSAETHVRESLRRGRGVSTMAVERPHMSRNRRELEFFLMRGSRRAK